MLNSHEVDEINAVGAWLIARDALSDSEFEAGIVRRNARHALLHDWIASGQLSADAVEGVLVGAPRRSSSDESDSAAERNLRYYARLVAQSFPSRYTEWREPVLLEHLRKGFVHGWCLSDDGSASLDAVDFVDGITAYGCDLVPIALEDGVLTVAEAMGRSVRLLEALLDRDVEVNVVASLPADVRAGLRWYYGRCGNLQMPDW